jgi:hypothetical protein
MLRRELAMHSHGFASNFCSTFPVFILLRAYPYITHPLIIRSLYSLAIPVDTPPALAYRTCRDRCEATDARVSLLLGACFLYASLVPSIPPYILHATPILTAMRHSTRGRCCPQMLDFGA